MEILIDSREKQRKIRAADFYASKGHSSTIKSLDVGDYVFSDQVVFEYKEIGDFMSSVLNESLFNEAMNQALVYPFHFVMVQGSVRSWLDDNWKYLNSKWGNRYDKYLHSNLGKYYGALRRLRTFTCPIIVEREVQAFDEMLLQAIKCLDGKSKFYSNVTRPVPSQDAVDVLLTSAKGISVKKAEAIRKTHTIDNIYDLMNLTINDFKLIDGIGDKTASNVYEFIHKGEGVEK
jgi:ERCC4-type nuclease